jgi:hypothetical protein
MAYIGNIPAEAYTNTVKDSFNGTGSATAFTLSQPTVTNDVRVVVENVVQDPTVAYSVSGTTLTFTSAPPSGTANIYVVHLGSAVMTSTPPSEIADATTFASNVSVQGSFTSQGIDDNATSNAMTLDGTGIYLDAPSTLRFSQSGGASSTTRTLRFASFNNGSEGYFGPNNDADSDASIRLGTADGRWSDLYLSGGVYLGGTGSANKLDDYEEGTWTPTIYGTSGGSLTLNAGSVGKYVKIGRFVQVSALQLQWTANSGISGMVALGGLPFPSDYNRYAGGSFGGSGSGSMSFTGQLNAGMDPSASFAWVMYKDPSNNTYSHQPTFAATGVIYGVTISYQTDA